MLKVLVAHRTPRLLYALDLVLSQVGEIEFSVVDDVSELSETDVVLNYSGKSIANSFQIHPSGLLFETDIRNVDIPFEYRSDDFLVSIFPTEFDDLGFDIFSASFFIASRYEEYRNFVPDAHGRYTPDQSISSKIGILQRPIINIWVKALKTALSEKLKINFLSKRKFEIINTLDIDNAWAYKNKGVFRSFGSVTKSILQKGIAAGRDQIKVLRGVAQDPYDTFEWLKEQQKEHKNRTIYFFLLGDYKKPYDTSISHKNDQLRSLIQEIKGYAEVGIHPSYRSYLSESMLLQEIERLQGITNSDTIISRNHFLRLSVPDSYRILEKLGVKQDYTMGYAQEPGFRAGLCTPYKIYDLLENRMIDVLIYPFTYMDGTLCEYKKMTSTDARTLVQNLKEEVHKVDGTFIAVWHNSSLNDLDHWKGWRTVYSESIK